MKKNTKKYLFYLFLFFFCLLFTNTVQALQVAPVSEPENININSNINSTETNTNTNITDIAPLIAEENEAIADLKEYKNTFYWAGDALTIKGHFLNDVVAIGNNLTIDGIVDGDVLAVGGTVIIRGEIKGNVRAVGGNIIIEGNVEKNATIAGSQLKIAENANIEKDFIAFGSYLEVFGTVRSNIQGFVKNISINNIINGDVNLGNVKQMTLGDQAMIMGNIEYTNTTDLINSQADKIKGEIIHKAPINPEPSENDSRLNKYLTPKFWLWSIIKLLSLLLIGVIIANVFSVTTEHKIKNLYCCPATNFFWGLVILLFVPWLCILLMVTVIGLPLGLITMALYIISIYLAPILIGAALGKQILKSSKSLVLQTVIGVIIFWFIKLIPYAGPIIAWLAISMALGAVMKKNCQSQSQIKTEKTNGKIGKKIKIAKNSKVKTNGKK